MVQISYVLKTNKTIIIAFLTLTFPTNKMVGANIVCFSIIKDQKVIVISHHRLTNLNIKSRSPIKVWYFLCLFTTIIILLNDLFCDMCRFFWTNAFMFYCMFSVVFQINILYMQCTCSAFIGKVSFTQQPIFLSVILHIFEKG
jgi:hypothetical protein